MRTSRTSGTRRRMAGFSMIEVLVSFVIFSFGMLGLAGLQGRMLTFSQSSLLRSQATALTDDVLERMRLDRLNAVNNLWNTDLGDAASSIPTGTAPYQFDRRDWKTQVETLLPAGQARITVQADAALNYTVTVFIQWNDSRGIDAQNTAGTEHFETQTRL